MELVPVWWPILLTALAVGGSAVRADAQIRHNTDRIVQVEERVQSMPERLARIEANQEATKAQLDRIESRLELVR
jgi:hypothetical protein